MTYKVDTTYVIGAGDWGTALSFVMKHAVNNLCLFSRKPGTHIAGLNVVNSLDEKIDLMVLALPSDQVENFLKGQGNLGNRQPENVIIATKGLYSKENKLMSDLVKSYYQKANIAVISGPNFASEIRDGMPTISTIAAEDIKYADFLCKKFSSPNFALYPSDDIIGVQLFGVFKNIFAIFCGILDAQKAGLNTRASFITKAIQEALSLIEKIGGKRETALSAAGIGDIILTCTSPKSRNYSFGKEFVLGQNMPEERTIEGIKSLKSIIYLAKQYNVNLPICKALHSLIIESDASLMKLSDLLHA